MLFVALVMSISLTAQNNCLDFDGENDYVDCGNSNSFQIATGTWEAWFYADPIGSSERYTIMSRYGSSGSFNYDALLRIMGDVNSKIHFYLESNSTYYALYSDEGIIAGEWYHVAVIWGSSGMKMYVNGILQTDTDSYTGGMTTSDVDFWIGDRAYTTHLRFDGKIDEIRVWDDIRTETEIRANMYLELTNPTIEANLVAYYKFDETTGTTADNAEGTSTLDGTLTGTGFSFDNNTLPSPAFAGPKNCLSFDGVNDWIETPETAGLDFTQFSISAWVMTNENKTAIILEKETWNSGWNIRQDNHNGWKASMYDVDGIKYDLEWGGGIPTLGQWYYVGLIFNGTTLMLGVDGELRASASVTKTLKLNNEPISIGSDEGNQKFFNGKIDEVRIYDVPLTPNQMRENLYKAMTGNESGLVAYYNFDNTSGTTLQDFSGNENNGTLKNMEDVDWVTSTAFNTWLNTSSSSWSTASNWSRGSAPSSSDNVGIQNYSGGSNPTFSSSTVHDISVASGVTFSVPSSLTTKGNFFNYGTFTINSTSSGTGSLIVEGAAIGDVIFKRYVDETAKANKWHYVSSPVAEQTLDNTWMSNNQIVNTPPYQFFRFDEDQNYWIIYGSTGNPEAFNDETFVDARGYAITRSSAGELSFTGTVRTDDVTYATTYTADKGEGFNLVGNPFTSSIGVTNDAASTEKFIAENTALLDDSYEALYIWDEQTGYTDNRNDYKVISNGAIGSYAKLPNNYIQPGQAFMVKVVSGGGNLEFNEDMQAHSTDNFYKGEKESWPSIELIAENSELFNSTAIGFNENMTLGLDPSYDIGKLKGNPNIALYTKLADDNGVDFAIQALPFEGLESVEIAVGIDVLETTILEFSANFEKLEEYKITLEDRQENIFTNLRKESYFAEVTESGTGRFFLHIKSTTAIGEITAETDVTCWHANKKVIIQNPNNETGLATISSVSGQILCRMDLNGDVNQEFNFNQPTGIYILSFQTSAANFNKKFFVK